MAREDQKPRPLSQKRERRTGHPLESAGWKLVNRQGLRDWPQVVRNMGKIKVAEVTHLPYPGCYTGSVVKNFSEAGVAHGLRLFYLGEFIGRGIGLAEMEWVILRFSRLTKNAGNG